jgi:hypothetical protein
MQTNNIFLVYDNLSDYYYTQVYGRLNEHIDWTIFEKTAQGQINYEPLQILFKNNKALKKDLLNCPGCNGLISKKVFDLFDEKCFSHFFVFPVFINNVPYFALHAKQRIDCLKPNDSQYTFLSTTEELWDVNKYAVDLSKIENSIFFSIPQARHLLYCTQDIGQQLLQQNLALVALPLLQVEEDTCAKIVYTNPFFGMSLQEPKNWRMSGPNIQKMREGKTITESSWKMDLPKKEEALLLFEMQRFELLKSDDWRQKAEIYVQLVNQTPEHLFAQRSAITPIEVPHPDVKFQARKNEYEWERCLMTPYRNELWWLIIVITRNDDPRYLQEALQVVQEIKFKK